MEFSGQQLASCCAGAGTRAVGDSDLALVVADSSSTPMLGCLSGIGRSCGDEFALLFARCSQWLTGLLALCCALA